MARQSAKPKSVVKPKSAAKPKSVVKPESGGKTAPLTMKEKVARLKKERQDTKQGGWLADKKAALSSRRAVASTNSLRRGKQR